MLPSFQRPPACSSKNALGLPRANHPITPRGSRLPIQSPDQHSSKTTTLCICCTYSQYISNAHWKQQDDKLNISKFSCASKPWNCLQWSSLPPTWGGSVQAQHLNSKQVLTALQNPSCSRFEMNLQPGDTLPWKFPADFARRAFPKKEELIPRKKNKRKIINNNYKKLVAWVNIPFQQHFQRSLPFWRLHWWSCRTWLWWLWIGRCCSPTRLGEVTTISHTGWMSANNLKI